MTGAIAHRGPDARGVILLDGGRGALGGATLAVVSSPEDAGPRRSRDGRWLVALNGELYNYVDLAQKLRLNPHDARDDIGVLTEGLSLLGLDVIGQITGMFAVAAIDTAARRAHLVVDRFGEKPLYYQRLSDMFIFGSEIRALRAATEGRLVPRMSAAPPRA